MRNIKVWHIVVFAIVMMIVALSLRLVAVNNKVSAKYDDRYEQISEYAKYEEIK